MEKMQGIDILLPLVMPQVMPCPQSMVLDTLQMLAVDFCKETGVWDAVFREEVQPCETVIPLPLPKGAVIASVTDFYLDDEKLERKAFDAGLRDITLREARDACAVATVKAALRPLRTSRELPEDILEEYGDILAFGAIAKIKAMSGQYVEWSDPQGMNTYYQLYQEGATRAKARKYRKRLGSGVLYVNTGEE